MVNVSDNRKVSDFGLVGHRYRYLLGKIHLGPHRRWGGAVSAVNSEPQAENFRRANLLRPRILNINGSPLGRQAQWESDFPWSMCAIMEKLRFLD